MEAATSADGTVVAYDRAGDGPPLIVCLARSFLCKIKSTYIDFVHAQFPWITGLGNL